MRLKVLKQNLQMINDHPDWVSVAKKVMGRNRTQCRNRYRYIELRGPILLEEPLHPEYPHTEQNRFPIDIIAMVVLEARAYTKQSANEIPNWNLISVHPSASHQLTMRSHDLSLQHQVDPSLSMSAPYPMLTLQQMIASPQVTVSHQMDAPYQVVTSNRNTPRITTSPRTKPST